MKNRIFWICIIIILPALILGQDKQKFDLFIRRIITYPIRKKIGLHLLGFICGGSSLDIQVEEFLTNCGFKIIQGYGLTEAGPIVTCNSYENPVIGSVGKPLEFQPFSIRDDGEIWIAGENIISEYFNRPELTPEYFENGWYKTDETVVYNKRICSYHSGNCCWRRCGNARKNLFNFWS